MGKYTTVADVGKTLINLLKNQMVPEPIQKPEMIGVCSPKERGAFVLGVHPYDLREETEVRSFNSICLPDGRLQSPSTSYELFYMISIASKAEESSKAIDEQRILGRLIQVINDNKVLPTQYMPDMLKLSEEEITIEMLKLDLDEKIKIWGMFNEPYRLSTFYSVKPVVIESCIIKKQSKRVSTISISSEIKK